MAINGECIYASRPVAPYSVNNIYYTRSKDNKHVYACWLSEKETVALPAVIQIRVSKTGKPKQVTMLAMPEKKMKFTSVNGVVSVQVPVAWQNNQAFKHSVVFKVSW